MILLMAFGWSGQVFAFACTDLVLDSQIDMVHHGGHDMASGQMDHGCPNCQLDEDCGHGVLHCVKAADKTDAFVAAKKVKSQDILVLPSEIQQVKTRHHQIRAPGLGIGTHARSGCTPISLHIRLQV